MYDIALSVAACARSGTRADVAWMIDPHDSPHALAFTPGGGRIGGLANGAFDGMLADAAARHLSSGRLIEHTVTEVEHQLSGIAAGTAVRFLVVPADQFPADSWSLLLDREPIAITVALDGTEVTSVTTAGPDHADPELREAMLAGRSSTRVEPGQVITVLAPSTKFLVAGQGPIAQALADQGALLGWETVVESRPDMVGGLAVALTSGDAAVILGHDVESSSRCLMAVLASDAGYIGALGSQKMQQARADWLAYQEVTDIERVHGPAGLDIQAQTPQEIAVAIAAQIILAKRHG